MLRKKSEMKDGGTKAMPDATRDNNNQESARTLTDEQVVTKRKLPARKFLSAAGMLLATGALAVASGAPTAPQTQDPDKAKSDSAGTPTQKAPDPDKKKAADPDKKKTKVSSTDAKKAKKDKTKSTEKPSDPDAKK